MKYTKLAAVALASVMMLSACGQSANSDNPIVMTVGDTQITESEFNYYMSRPTISSSAAICANGR